VTLAATIELSTLIWNRSVPPIGVLLLCRSKRSTGGGKTSHKRNRNGDADVPNHTWFSLNKGGIKLSPIRLGSYYTKVPPTTDFGQKVDIFQNLNRRSCGC